MRPVLEVRDLRKHFPVTRGLLRRRSGSLRAVDGISFRISPGETLGLVGESGSGKSTTARALLRLVRPSAGQVLFEGRDLAEIDAAGLRRVRRDLQMIFQDPYASLNPRMRIEAIVREPLDIHGIDHPRGHVVELLERVGLGKTACPRFPHQLSGGQRQRVAIARALATSPQLLIADEPISALDVSIQAQIVNLLADLKEDLGLTYLFIAHDLSMVRHLSDRVAVMYLGKIVEIGERDAVFGKPLHPYTQALIGAIPVPTPQQRPAATSPSLQGEIPSPVNPPSGCRFRTRCVFATELCAEREPDLRTPEIPAPETRNLEVRQLEAGQARVHKPEPRELGVQAAEPSDPEARDMGDARTSHRVACHYAEQIAEGSHP